MLHVAIRSARGSVLFRTWREARALWDQLTRRVRCYALVLMPEHIHSQLPDERQLPPLFTALRAYALWRHHARGESGPVWEHDSRPTPIRGPDHVERTRRYIHLNPCRRGLVSDPLAWPFSTHRDAVGLALPAACRTVRDPERFHAYVSADPTTHVSGTRFPARREGPLTLREVEAAVSAVTRTPLLDLTDEIAARQLLIRAASALTHAPAAEIARLARVHASTVARNAAVLDPSVELIATVAGDPRFAGLDEGELRWPSRIRRG